MQRIGSVVKRVCKGRKNFPSFLLWRVFVVCPSRFWTCVCVSSFLDSNSGIFQRTKIWKKDKFKKHVEIYCGSSRSIPVKKYWKLQKISQKTFQNLKIWRKSKNLRANPRSEIWKSRSKIENAKCKTLWWLGCGWVGVMLGVGVRGWCVLK